MAYPDLPPGPTFWRCPNCGNETLFRASGVAHIECGRCHQVWTVDQLKDAHAKAHAQPVAS
jgi:phage FluMu protein Com